MTRRTEVSGGARAVAAVALLLVCVAVRCDAQTAKAGQATTVFEVISLKYSGNTESHRVFQNGENHYVGRRVEYQGRRMSGDSPLNLIIDFAFSPLISPYRQEVPDWTKNEYYQIDAIAPEGATLDAAKAMLRNALAQRMGLRYHLVDRETSVYNLVRGSGALKLAPATGKDADPGARQTGVFKMKSASLADFAGFVSSFARRSVIDRTGLDGRYSFDVDWRDELRQDPGNTPAVALETVRRLGLKLEPAKAMVKVLVVDSVNKEPTAN